MFNIQLSLNDLDGSNGFFLGLAEELSTSIAGTIDINGDGIEDLIAGSRNVNDAAVLFGDTADRTARVSLSTLDGSDGFVINGGANALAFPQGLEARGDFNGDGIQDIVFGGPRIFTPEGGDQPGDAVIILGALGPVAFEAAEDVSNLADVRITGIDNNSGFGREFAFADVNGDGFDDLIAGSTFSGEVENGGANRTGETYVIFGGASVIGDIDPAALDGSDGFRLTATTGFGGDLGRDITSVGDFNNDGFEDFAVTAPESSRGSIEGTGSVFLIFGAANGFTSEIDLGSLDGQDGLRFFTSNNRELLQPVVSGGGDFNGDGIEDLVIGSAFGRASLNGGELGEVSVIFGTDVAQSANFGLESLTAPQGFTVFGGRVGDRFGGSIDFGQDFNGDGFSDIAIGAPNAVRASNFDQRGEVSIILGRADDPTGGRVRTIEQIKDNGVIQFQGVSIDSELGRFVEFVGDINGDSFDDLAILGGDANEDDQIFVVNGGGTLEDGVATAQEGASVIINVFGGSAFSPVNAPITEIEGQTVVDGDSINTSNGSSVEVINALAGEVRFTPGTSF